MYYNVLLCQQKDDDNYVEDIMQRNIFDVCKLKFKIA